MGLHALGLEEGPDRGTATTFADPQDTLGIGVQHHAGVAMALVEGQLIHRETPRLRLGQARHRNFQSPLVKHANGAPVQTEQLRHVCRGHPGA